MIHEEAVEWLIRDNCRFFRDGADAAVKFERPASRASASAKREVPDPFKIPTDRKPPKRPDSPFDVTLAKEETVEQFSKRSAADVYRRTIDPFYIG